MSKFVVFVDDSIVGQSGFAFNGTATVSAAVTSASVGLHARRAALTSVAAALFDSAKIPKGVMLNMQVFESASAGQAVSPQTQILEGVGAIVLDDADVMPESLAGIAGLEVVENFTLHLPSPVLAAAAPPPSDWHLTQIGAWATGATGQEVLVGILDTGIDATHPEFAGRPIHFAEFDSNGNLISTVPRDAGDHGTHVAGIVAGVTRGVAPDASLAVAAVLTGPQGSGSLVQVLNGMNWLITHPFRGQTIGVDVLNASLGAPGFHPFLQTPVRSGRALGILTIAAAGNDGLSAGFHGSPGNYPNVLGVGATDITDRVAGFSAWGVAPPPAGPAYPVPALSAPGVAVDSAKPGGGFQRKSGTSMATPVVTGVAAQRLQAHPALRGNPAALLADLIGNTVAIASGPNGNLGGIGRIVA